MKQRRGEGVERAERVKKKTQEHTSEERSEKRKNNIKNAEKFWNSNRLRRLDNHKVRFEIQRKHQGNSLTENESMKRTEYQNADRLTSFH
jgi:hypothetical protein